MRTASGQSLPFPATPHLRTALLEALECVGAIATYPPVRWREVSSFAPQIVAGTTETLQTFADGVIRGEWHLRPLDTAVFNLTPLGHDPLTPAQRDKLWRAFHVPIYDLLFDRDEGVLASECEAYEGWHVRHKQLRFDMQTGAVVFRKNGIVPTALTTGLTARGLDSMCACGDDAPLLRGIEAHHNKPLRVRAIGA
jgi:hypothetical protein